MNRAWVIWALVLVLAGGAGVGGIYLDRYRFEQQIAAYRDHSDEAQQQYLALYEEWSRLPGKQKAEQPWGHGRFSAEDLAEQLQADQQSRLQADLSDLASGARQPHVLSDVLYGEGWRQQVQAYQKKQEIRDIVQMASMASMAAGGFLLLCVALRGLFRLARRKSHRKKPSSQPAAADAPTPAQQPAARQAPAAPGPQPRTPAPDRTKLEPDSPGSFVRARRTGSAPDAPPLFESAKQKDAPRTPRQSVVSAATRLRQSPEPIGPEHYRDQFQPATGYGNVATLMSTDPIASSDSLSELTQEMSAIREFAAQQQDRVKQLQDGYDWNLIKRFCLRIIRCVDNLEARIAQLTAEKQDTSVLDDVRDELLFALESSGVEQFEPELEADYKGLEKKVEAVRTRVKTNSAKLKGKIAQIVRPGYHYVVNDDEVKVVRCSQVKLYG